jgi:NADH:ubiquinone oxidoreductase subunit K
VTRHLVHLSARAQFVAYGLVTVAACWAAIGCAICTAWCRICHHSEQRELASSH